jgi:hypothetical protein
MKGLIRSKSETDFYFLNENMNHLNYNLNKIKDLKSMQKSKEVKPKTQTFCKF